MVAGVSAQEQQNAPPQAPPTTVIRTETRLVLVDAVVTDKKGAYIHDLTQKDFKVWEDNKEQNIKSFSFEAEANGPNKDQKRYLVLFFDNANMAVADQSRAREAAGKFVDSNAGPNRLIAVADFSGTLRIVQNFTEDADRLHEVVKNVKLASGPTIAGPGSGGLGRVGYDYGVRTSLLALRSMAKNLSDVPGRKSLVFFTSGFGLDMETQSELTATISECNRANVAVYPVDVRGLTTTDPLGPPLGVPGGRGRGPGQAMLDNPSPRLFGGARIFMASFAPDPQRGGPTGGGTSSGSGSVSSGGSTGGGAAGRPSGGATGTGGNTSGGGRSAAPTGGTGRAPSGSNSGEQDRRWGHAHQQPHARPALQQQSVRQWPLHRTDHPPLRRRKPAGALHARRRNRRLRDLNTNDLLGGLEKIGKEQNEYYLLGYSPSESPEGAATR